MRFASFILILMGLASFSPGRGEEYIVTDTGTTTPINSGMFSTVPSGTPFTFTVTYNTSTTTVTTGTTYTGPGVESYVDPSGTATLTFGSYSFSDSAPEFQVFSDYAGGIYGYQFSDSAGEGDSFATKLWSVDSSVASDTTLSSIQSSPISDFSLEKDFAINTPDGGIGGIVTSFSVSEVAAP